MEVHNHHHKAQSTRLIVAGR